MNFPLFRRTIIFFHGCYYQQLYFSKFISLNWKRFWKPHSLRRNWAIFCFRTKETVSELGLCIYGLLCQPVVAISFETLSWVDFVKCNKEYFKYQGLGKNPQCSLPGTVPSIFNTHFFKRHLIHTYSLLLYFLTHQNVIFQEHFDAHDTFGLFFLLQDRKLCQLSGQMKIFLDFEISVASDYRHLKV